MGNTLQSIFWMEDVESRLVAKLPVLFLQVNLEIAGFL